MLHKLRILLLLILFSVGLPISATMVHPASSDTLPSDTLRISLITCAPGPDVYQIFGHSALRVECSGVRPADLVFNYGMFSFSDDFVFKFVKGETDYMLGAYDYRHFIVDYVMRGSSVYEQELNLDPAQEAALFEALLINAMPQHRIYRYNFLFDNCATRPRDMIERTLALGGEQIVYTAPDTLYTFRELIRTYGANYSWLTFGIDLALGRDLDRKATWHEEMFVPLILQEAFDEAVIVSQTGEQRSVVKGSTTLYDSGMVALLPPTPWYCSPLFIMLLWLAVTLFVTLCDWHRGKVSRWYDTILNLLVFVSSLIIYFLVFVSEHPATTFNLHALWLTPLAVIPAILPYFAAMRKVVRGYHILYLSLLALFLILVICKVQCIDVAVLPLIAMMALRSYNYLKCTKTSQTQ